MLRLKVLHTTAAAVLLSFPASAETVTLDFPTYQLDQSFGPWWQSVVNQYQADNPNVEINLTQSPSNDHHKSLVTRMVGGNPPQILHMTARFLWGHQANGFIAPLDDCFEGTTILEDSIPSQARFTIDGNVYAKLMLEYAFGMFYNKAMFEEAGIALPTTMEETVAAAKALTKDTDNDGRIDQYGIALNTAPSSWGFVEFMHFHAGRDRNIVENGQLDSEEEIRATLAIINDLTQFGATPTLLDNNPKREVFWSGNAAMYIDGSWAQDFPNTRATDEVKEEWAVMPLPFKNMAAGPSNVLAIASGLSDAEYEAACGFIKLASSPEWQAKYSEMTGNPAARAGSVTEAARETWPDLPMFEASLEPTNLRSHLPEGLEADFNEFSSIVMEGVTAMVADGMTPADAAAKIHGQLTERFF